MDPKTGQYAKDKTERLRIKYLGENVNKTEATFKFLKAKVALAALKGDKTLAQLSKDFSITPNLISKWKLQLLTGAKDLFEKGGATGTSTGPETELIS